MRPDVHSFVMNPKQASRQLCETVIDSISRLNMLIQTHQKGRMMIQRGIMCISLFVVVLLFGFTIVFHRLNYDDQQQIELSKQVSMEQIYSFGCSKCHKYTPPFYYCCNPKIKRCYNCSHDKCLNCNKTQNKSHRENSSHPNLQLKNPVCNLCLQVNFKSEQIFKLSSCKHYLCFLCIFNKIKTNTNARQSTKSILFDADEIFCCGSQMTRVLPFAIKFCYCCCSKVAEKDPVPLRNKLSLRYECYVKFFQNHRMQSQLLLEDYEVTKTQISPLLIRCSNCHDTIVNRQFRIADQQDKQARCTLCINTQDEPDYLTHTFKPTQMQIGIQKQSQHYCFGCNKQVSKFDLIQIDGAISICEFCNQNQSYRYEKVKMQEKDKQSKICNICRRSVDQFWSGANKQLNQLKMCKQCYTDNLIPFSQSQSSCYEIKNNKKGWTSSKDLYYEQFVLIQYGKLAKCKAGEPIVDCNQNGYQRSQLKICDQEQMSSAQKSRLYCHKPYSFQISIDSSPELLGHCSQCRYILPSRYMVTSRLVTQCTYCLIASHIQNGERPKIEMQTKHSIN